ncbi:MAG: cysteine--tRNA ligase [Alphaproteobacteria bacterium]|nr:cysteine--tRNA ligase [Alphaproteobacteria bacterium]
MALTLYNTLTRKKEPFTPIDPVNVRMYVCGPTVYDFAHIGNARPVIVFDVLYRLLRHVNGESHVTYVRNITDVDDKINDRAARDYPDMALNEAIRKVTESTAAQFHADVAALGCLPPTVEPRATDNIQEMVGIINRLINNGHAYIAKGEQGREVLFEVGSMPAYGALSNRKLDEQIEGARVAVEVHKRHAADFVLWKESSPSEPGWNGAFVEAGAEVSIYGRPGWHIECSAMSHRYLGEMFDIHGGGIDLVFPHHENEIAQSCCAFGQDVMAKVWMHNGFLQVEGQKMSKSLGNFVTINELLATNKFGGRSWPGDVLRLAMLKTHYRQPIDFTVKALEEAEKTLANWAELAGRHHVSLTSGSVDPALLDALCDDLNTASAFAVLSDLARKAKVNSQDAQQLAYCADFLGLNTKAWFSNSDVTEAMADRDPEWLNSVTSLIEARIEARRTKNFAESDRIRDELVAMDIQIKDGKDAGGNPTTTWEVKR